jgi:hypothetical protein
VASAEWDQYWTVLVAPEIYITRGHDFDAAVTLEQVSSLLSSVDPKRRQFRAGVIKQAIKKASQTGVQVVDPTMTAFTEAYFAFFKAVFKHRAEDVSMRSPAPVYKGEVWFRISSRFLPKGVYIHHKADRGFVDLTFPDTNAGRIKSFQPSLESGMTVHQTGKSSAIRKLVPAIESWSNFTQEVDKVVDAFAAVTELLDFYVNRRTELDSITGSASTSG